MKHVFLVDTNSKKSMETGKKIEQLGNKDYVIFYVTDPNRLQSFLNSCYGQISTLYCIGGDDHLNNIVNQLSYQVPIHVIPTGEDNDFFKRHRNVKDMVYADVGVLNGTTKFMTCAHFGTDQRISENLYQSKRNFFNYVQMKTLSMIEGDEEEFLNINGIWNDAAALSIYVGENQQEDFSKDSFFTVKQINSIQYDRMKKLFCGLPLKSNQIQIFQIDSLNISSIYPTICWYDGIPMRDSQLNFEFDLLEQEVMITNNVPNSVKKITKTLKK